MWELGEVTSGYIGYRGATEVLQARIFILPLAMKILPFHIFAVRKPYLFIYHLIIVGQFIYLIQIQNKHTLILLFIELNHNRNFPN